ncbi:MAG: RiPP maturation radical SAM C-methyltransferase [Candidatus Omnitrophota bacterium]
MGESNEDKTTKIRTALVSMPVLAGYLPSFQLALLKPTLQREGIDVQTFSMYMYFGMHIGYTLNEVLSEARPCIAGEWIWSKAAFGQFNEDKDYISYYKESLEDLCNQADCTIDDLLEIRNNKTFSFIEFCLNRIDWSRFQLIGFSVVFQQMASSIALARALKGRYPHIPIIFGGGTFEDDIAESIMTGCPFIDYIHCGDADKTLPEMIHRLERDESMEGLPGLMWRKDGQIIYNGRSPILNNMDITPVPDYDEYFYAYKESGYSSAQFPGKKNPMLPIETARGCWWGMKNHCTFCGLNRAGLEFRCKSAENVLGMLKTLSRKYNYLYFNAIDNIMAPEYIEKVFGRLADNRSDFLIHYEVRPCFTRAQLKRLKSGGLFSVQPGIESFSTHILQLMKKHIIGIRNIEFVKWCTYYGIVDLYNLLFGFPGETIEDYELQCKVISKIPHFQPPYAITRARAERGSPMYLNRWDYAISDMIPAYCYNYIFPGERFDLQHVSYYFMHKVGNTPEVSNYRNILSKVAEWKKRWETGSRPKLRYHKSVDTVHVEDTRSGVLCRYVYMDREAELIEFLDDASSWDALTKRFDDDVEWLQKTLADLMEKDLVLHMDDRYLNLALPANPYR